MKEFYKRGRRLFAAFLGALVMMNQLGILTPAVVHGQEVGSVTYEAVNEGGENLTAESNDTKAVKNQTVLTFTSDIHNASNNTAANRLDSWLDGVIDTYGGIDAQSFCGDMGEAGDTTDKWWTYVQTVMDVVEQKSLPGVYTTGNHEFYNGKFATTSNPVKNNYIIDKKALEGSNYIIYCLGTDNWDNYSDNYTTDQIAKLQSFLNSAGKAKPIIILTHYPLHRYSSSRETKNADKVIEALNNGAASGQKIVLLWGHNHTMSDTNYDEIFEPGRTIEYASGKSETIQFYYAAAGCMSDSEYGTGSAFVKGKGLVIRINDEDKLTFTYYDASGKNDVTEGGTYTEADPVDATAIAVSPKTLTVQTGESANLGITYTPSDTTNRKITWTSSDPSVATVSGGKVTGVSKGTATITATYTDNPDLTDSATVTVTKAAGSGVTPEYGKKYVILASDGYALTSEGDTVGYTNGDSSQEFNYIGLSGEEYTVGDDVIPDRFLWTFISAETKAGESYYIQSNDGRYLNGLYEENETGGYDGTLKLDDTKDIWVITAPTSGSTVSGSILKSTNASQSDSGAKYLTHGNSGSNSGSGNTNIFTLRSEDNATISMFYEYDDEGNYVPDPDEPDDPPTPPTPTDGAIYKLTDNFTSGKDYLIVSANTAGSGYALTNPGGTSGGADMGSTGVTIKNGDVDEDGTNDTYISTDKTDVVWTATTSGSGFSITNNTDYLEGKSGNVKIFSSQQYADRFWSYTDSQLKHSGGNNTYVVYYSNGFTSTYNSTSEKIYLYEKVDGGTEPENPDDPDDPPTPPTPTDGAIYKLTDNFTSGKDYLIVSANAAGSGYALTNPGGTSGGAGMGSTGMTIKSGDVDEDGTNDTYISTDKTDVVWTATANGSGFDITNSTDYLEGKSGNVKIFSSQQYADRFWSYTDSQLKHSGGTNTYVVYYSNGFTSTYDSTSEKIYLYEKVDGGTEPENPDEPDVPPTPPTPTDGAIYKLTDNFTSGKDYLIVSANAAGSGYALTNPGGTSGGADMGSTGMTIKSGDVDEDGTNDTYISTDKTDVVWTATANGSGFDITNSTDYLEGKSGNVKIFSSQQYADRFWSYTDSQLMHSGGNNTYVVYYSNGFTSTYNSTSEKIYLYEKVDGGTEPENPDDPPQHTHNWDEGTVTKESTCKEEGEMTYTCTVCGEIKTEPIDKKPHTEEVIEGKDATCTENGLTDGKKCSVCGEILEAQTEIPATGHTEVVIPGKDATCTEAGLTDGKKCSVCGEILETQTEIPATGHTEVVIPGKDATCTETGLTEGKKCSVCGKILVEQTEIPAKDHTWDEGKVTKEATCTEPGQQIFTCTVCGATREVEISASGHKWSFKGFTWVKDGEDYTATAEYVCDNDDAHVETVTPDISKIVIEPTCTESGSITYTAIISGKTAPDHKDREYVKEIDKPALGHTIIIHEAKAATCEEDGITEGQECSVCKEILKKQITIPKLGHEEEILEAVDPTCTKSGLTEGKKCSRCKKILVAQEEIPAIGHDWDDGIITKDATCTEDGEKFFTCKNDAGHTKIEVISAKGHEWSFKKFSWIDNGEEVTAALDYVCKNDETHTQTVTPEITQESVDATCTVPGKITYTATISKENAPDGILRVYTKEIDGHTLDHSWDKGKVKKEASCTEDGLMTYTCTACGETKEETIKATGHTIEIIRGKDATCTKVGLTDGKKCSVCGEILEAQKEIPAKGHTEEIIKGKDATCTETGLSDGKKCSVCGEILEAQTVIPVKDHTWDEGKVTKEATCTEPGEQVFTCTVCETTKKAEIPANGHKWSFKEFTWVKDGEEYTAAAEYVCVHDNTHVETVTPDISKKVIEPTCTESGLITYTATISEEAAPDHKDRQYVKEIDKPALGHTIIIHEAKAATCEEDGITEGQECSVCGEVLKKQIIVPKLGHEEVILEAVEPTCTEPGLTEGKKCSRCDKILVAQEEIPAIGHDWDDGTITKEATCTEAGEKLFTCKNDASHTKTEAIPSKGHAWSFKKFTWNDGGEEVTATFDYICENDATHTQTITAEVSGESVDATCTVPGKVTYTATISKESAPDGILRVYTKEIDGHTLDHAWDKGIVKKAATCIEDGIMTYTCTACGETKEEAIKATGHTEEVIKGKDATCTEPGLTDGKKCSVCGEIIEAQKEIPAKGHTEEVIKGIDATETATGLTDGKKCSVCGEILEEQKVIPKITPSKENSDNKVPTKIPDEISPSNPVSAASVDKQILNAKTDGDPKGSVFGLLQAKGVAKGKTSIKVSWKKVAGAKEYIVYGNKCGTNYRFKKLLTVKSTSFTQKKLKKGTYYKYLIVAVNGNKALATSKGIHVATKGGKVGNSKSVTTNAKKSKVTLNVGKTFNLKVKANPQNKKLKVKKHRAIAYESGNKKIATISSKGVIKAVRKGTCYVYAYAQNGVCKKIKVTVK